ncbi:MAG: SDR family NAD(P)-dependent oxidoreductase, partial [Pyrinomonadaceae bacterium]
MLSLKGQAAVLVGGAGSIGSATALLLSELGAGIVICDQDEAAAGNLKVKLDAAGRHCDMLVLDGCDDKKVGAAAASIAQKCGRIDILVHLLGGSVARHLLDTDMENVRQDIERNLTSAVLWAKATLPQMMKQRSGVMLFCSSVNTRLG